MKNKLLLLFFIANFASLSAQIGFYENIILGKSYLTESPQLVKAADVDGDNDLDVVTFGTELNWYQNDGAGNFGEKRNVAPHRNGTTASSLYLIDLDHDGDLDILSSTGIRFTIYRNVDGLGNFEIIQSLALGSYPLTVAPADIDSDGHLDVVCFYETVTTQSLVWYKNDGTGNFGEQQLISDADAISSTSLLTAEDLDGDHDDDLILTSNYSKIFWLKNTNGTFSMPITVSELASGIISIVTSDMDHDGNVDIIAASATDNQVVWYKNLNGTGTFSNANPIVSNLVESNAVLVADINNDNTIDVVYTGGNEIGWLSNTNGLGNFGSRQLITNKAFGVRAVAMADLDGDGKNDLISASQDDNKVAWYKHIDGNGNFGRQVVISRSAEFPNNVYPGDFDGDNDIDLLVSSHNDAKLSWFENVNGLGFYGKQHIITENTGSGNRRPITYPVDIDGDGDLDIVAVKAPVFLWYENDGQGNFIIEHPINTSESTPTIIRAQDLDGDGDMDLVCGVYNADKISWYQNLDGHGTFGTERIIADTQDDNGSLTALEIADMDGDHDMDIIGSSYNGNIHFYKNTNGAGSFALQQSSFFNSMQSIYPADIDGDGDNDIVGVSINGGGAFDAVVWFENDGQGNFTDKHSVSDLRIHGQAIHAADVDNDGDMDVLTAAGHVSTSGQLAWYENTDGLGHFSERQMIHEVFSSNIAWCVATADVDNDNDIDVIGVFGWGSSTEGKVSVFENLGILGNTIQGTVLIDTDGNGCTNADVKAANLLAVSSNGSHSFGTFTDQNGKYQLATTPGTLTTSIASSLPDYFISNPASQVSDFSGMNNTFLADFCVAPIGQINDLEVSVYPLQEDLRPGFPSYYRIVYRNKGTTIINGSINFTYDSNKLLFLTANQTISSQTATTLVFDFENVNLFETRTIDLKFNVFAPPVTNINDRVVANVTVNPVSGDATAANNSYTLNQTVIGSYDPNDITCLEGDEVRIADADKYLHYIIRFQNTGSASAINVRVENTLDDKLDSASLQLESLSHNGSVEIKDGSEIKFIFDNIHLPDSTTNEPKSHGFIAYKIKPLNSVAVNDVVNNVADIYFDFNPPIITNTAATQFVETLSVAQIDTDQVKVFPNPTTHSLNIKANTIIKKVSVIDINGRILKEFNLNNPTLSTQLDLADLTTGIYFVKIKTDKGSTNKKIIKK